MKKLLFVVLALSSWAYGNEKLVAAKQGGDGYPTESALGQIMSKRSNVTPGATSESEVSSIGSSSGSESDQQEDRSSRNATPTAQQRRVGTPVPWASQEEEEKAAGSTLGRIHQRAGYNGSEGEGTYPQERSKGRPWGRNMEAQISVVGLFVVGVVCYYYWLWLQGFGTPRLSS